MLSARCREPRPSQFSPRLQVRVISTSNIYLFSDFFCLDDPVNARVINSAEQTRSVLRLRTCARFLK